MPIAQPKISVIIPVYNVESYLRQCLDSVVRQTIREIEIICVNDGSTDGSLAILMEYSNQYENVILIDKKKSGYGASVNCGLAIATGEFVGIVEPDDFIDHSMYEKLYEKGRRRKDVDVIKSPYYRYYDFPGKEITKVPIQYDAPTDPFPVTQSPALLMYHPSVWSSVYRRSFLQEQNIRMVEAPGAGWVDNPFSFKALCLARKICWYTKPLYYYRQTNPDSSSNNLTDCTIPLTRLREMFDFVDEAGITDHGILFNLYGRVFAYINIVLNNVNYHRETIRPLITAVVRRINPEILRQSARTPETWLRNYERFSADYQSFTRQNNIKVSVIIPVYNAEKYLRACLESVVNQTLSDREVICIDDGSYDRSRVILREYEEDHGITVLCQKNSGVGAARNKGMALASGEYLSFLDADDFFFPELLETLYRTCLDNEAELAIVGSRGFDNERKVFFDMPWAIRKKALPDKNPFSWTDIPDRIFNICSCWAWDKLFQRAFLEANQISFQDIHSAEDLIFVMSALVKANRIAIDETILINYRTNLKDSLSASGNKTWHDFFHALFALKVRLEANGIYQTVRQSYVNWALGFSLYYVSTLRGKKREQAILFLNSCGFELLDIEGQDETFFYSPDDYRNYKNMRGQNDFYKWSDLRHRAVRAEENLRSTMSSKSYRIGRVITWAPRRLRDTRNCIREVGLRRTLGFIKRRLLRLVS